MPRPNPLRTIDSEAILAARVAFEREARGWSYETLAEKMGEVGCPIQASAMYKIEKGRPRRRITVDELAAFARVFDKEVGALLASPDAAMQGLFERWDVENRAALEARERADQAFQELARYVQSDAAAFDPFARLVNDWAEAVAGEDLDMARYLTWKTLWRVAPTKELEDRAYEAARIMVENRSKEA